MSKTTRKSSMSRREPTMPIRSKRKAPPDCKCKSCSCGRTAGCNCGPMDW